MHNLKPLYTYGPLLLALVVLNSCGALKPLQSPAGSSAPTKSSPFLDDIVVNAGGPSSNNNAEEKMPQLVDNYSAPMKFNTGINIGLATNTQFKFAILLNTEVEHLSNLELYRLIEDWWGTPYKIGGMTKRGVDCSAFVQNLQAAVFELALPRTAAEQKAMCQEISRDELTEGDLVFFNTRGGVSHVGVYLHNNKFVHASTSGGVTISDLAEPYWQKRFISAGRPTK